MPGKKFPDLTGDGKVTRKDILKGRGVSGFKDGGEVDLDELTPRIKKKTRVRPFVSTYDVKETRNPDSTISQPATT